jgi:hypothetical protein
MPLAYCTGFRILWTYRGPMAEESSGLLFEINVPNGTRGSVGMPTSSKANDIGFERALLDWIIKHRSDWREDRLRRLKGG